MPVWCSYVSLPDQTAHTHTWLCHFNDSIAYLTIYTFPIFRSCCCCASEAHFPLWLNFNLKLQFSGATAQKKWRIERIGRLKWRYNHHSQNVLWRQSDKQQTWKKKMGKMVKKLNRIEYSVHSRANIEGHI